MSIDPWKLAQHLAEIATGYGLVEAKPTNVSESQGGYLLTLFVKERAPRPLTEAQQAPPGSEPQA